jgi:hypothetical protein
MSLVRVFLAAGTLACAAPQPKAEPLAPPAAAAAQPPAAAEAKPPAPKQPYSGHGAASVPQEVLDRFAPKPLPDALTRTIQAMLDVRAPSAGVLAPDGSALYFR